jgi:hypothetical protein
MVFLAMAAAFLKIVKLLFTSPNQNIKLTVF